MHTEANSSSEVLTMKTDGHVLLTTRHRQSQAVLQTTTQVQK